MNESTSIDREPSTFARNDMASDAERAERRLALAAWKAEHGQPSEARRLFEESIDLDQAGVSPRMSYAAFLARQDDWITAKQILDQAMANDVTALEVWLSDQLANTPDDVSLMHLQALFLTRLGRYDEAKAVFKQLLSAVPDKGQVLVDQAATLETLNEWEAADDSYRAALEDAPDNVEWLAAYGMFLEKIGRDEEALANLKQARELAPHRAALQRAVERLKPRVDQHEEARKWAALARLRLEEQNDVDEAARLAAKALRKAPDCALAHRVQSMILARSGFLIQAENHLARAVELEPDNPDYYTAQLELQDKIESRQQRVKDLVRQAHASKDREVAYAFLDEALALIADDVDTHITYAELLEPKQSDDVEEHLRIALTASPRHPEANERYAMFLHKQGRVQEAEQYFVTALEGQPQDEELIDEYTEWLIEQGRYEEAADHLQSATQVLTTNSRLQGRLAAVWARTGQLSKSLSQFETALEGAPQDASLHREYAWTLRESGRLSEAEEHLCTALELDSDDVDAHQDYAALLMTQQRYSEAQNHIQRALRLRPDDGELQIKARAIEEQLRRFKPVEEELAYAVWLSQHQKPESDRRAQEAFERALNMDPDSVVVLKEFASFLERHGELDYAKEMLSRVLAITPDQEAEGRHQAIVETLESRRPPERPTVAPPPPSETVSESFWERVIGTVKALFGI